MKQADNYQLRRADPQDEEFLFRLFAEHQRDTFQLLNISLEQQHVFLSMQFRARNAGHAAGHPQAVNNIICTNEATPIGRILTSETEDALHLIDIALISAYQGQGIGSSILMDLQKQCGMSGKRMDLHVPEGSPAKNLYVRLGFRPRAQATVYTQMEWRGGAPSNATCDGCRAESSFEPNLE